MQSFWMKGRCKGSQLRISVATGQPLRHPFCIAIRTVPTASANWIPGDIRPLNPAFLHGQSPSPIRQEPETALQSSKSPSNRVFVEVNVALATIVVPTGRLVIQRTERCHAPGLCFIHFMTALSTGAVDIAFFCSEGWHPGRPVRAITVFPFFVLFVLRSVIISIILKVWFAHPSITPIRRKVRFMCPSLVRGTRELCDISSDETGKLEPHTGQCQSSKTFPEFLVPR